MEVSKLSIATPVPVPRHVFSDVRTTSVQHKSRNQRSTISSSKLPLRSPSFSNKNPFFLKCSSPSPSLLCRSIPKTQPVETSFPEPASKPSDLAEYIAGGPLIKSLAPLSLSDIRANLSEWEALGEVLSRQLDFPPGPLGPSERLRIFRYYLPLYFWCLQQLDRHKKNEGRDGKTCPPLVIGISAPQGCGKTTIVESLEHLFAETGRKAASISIDDFYLTFDEQTELSKKHPGNSLLELRGNAGSHDLQLGEKTLQSLKNLEKTGETVRLPRYDKGARGGRGDRAPVEQWRVVSGGAVEVILLEGWMLGFEPLEEKEAQAIQAELVAVNGELSRYATWHRQVDAWIVVQVQDPAWVYKWRLQAEVQMRNRGKPGMTDEQVADFVSRYMPAYKAYLPRLYGEGPRTAVPEKTLKFLIDESRSPLEC